MTTFYPLEDELQPDAIAETYRHPAHQGRGAVNGTSRSVGSRNSTATTCDYVTGRGELHRRSDCPSLGISLHALVEHAAKLHRVEVIGPRAVIGRTMVGAIQSGLIFGHPALVECGIREPCEKAQVVASGGLADLIVPESTTIEDVHEFLMVKGLRLIFERNRSIPPLHWWISLRRSQMA